MVRIDDLLQAGDRWVDSTQDGQWVVVIVDDGLRLKFCENNQDPPPSAHPRDTSYVLANYGGMTLVKRNGSYAVPSVTIRPEAPPTAPARHGLPRGHRW